MEITSMKNYGIPKGALAAFLPAFSFQKNFIRSLVGLNVVLFQKL